MSTYDPLHDPDVTLPTPSDLDTEMAVAQRILGETASLNIHSKADMQSAAFALNTRLRVLLAAIQAERGESR